MRCSDSWGPLVVALVGQEDGCSGIQRFHPNRCQLLRSH
ncbi:MAG: hypothetical protein KatS3mg111_1833 [Pirellulaceae bacterium]|nr:MAG: hypothetical protein KatS3mg111_1833 [Pirellulaceae bacterium]